MINQELVNKIHSLLDKGVTYGLSKDPKPGEMCLEQAICYALGEEVNDEPSCVDEQVRYFIVLLNDCSWSSDSARAEGMRNLAIAQLGSNSLNQKEFRDKLSFAMITKLLPAMFRDLGEEKWEKEIKSLEGAKDLKEAIKAAYDVGFTFAASDDANVNNFAIAAIYAAVNAAYAAHHAAYAVANAAYATKTRDKYFKMASHLGVEVLKEMKSHGCQFI